MFSELMEHLLNLPICVLVTTGRTGSDLLQSLLDSHPQVVTFNGQLLFHDFWENSKCVMAGEFNPGDFVDEFVGVFIERFKSRYDLFEKKNKLGKDLDQSVDIDIPKFKLAFLNLVRGRKMTLRTAFTAIYGAYALALGQKIEDKTVIFHHEHILEHLHKMVADFPNVKLLCTTRDPRANFVSCILHTRKFNPKKDREGFLYSQIRRILADAQALEKFGRDYRAIRLEDMGNIEVLGSLCDWLGIDYDDCIKSSTWAGLLWHGDALSQVEKKGDGFSPEMLVNRWDKKLAWRDKYVLNYIMYYRLKEYGYSYNKTGLSDILLVPVLILFPLRFEMKFFSPKYILRHIMDFEFKTLAANVIRYPMRVCLFFKYYFDVTVGNKFSQPLLR